MAQRLTADVVAAGEVGAPGVVLGGIGQRPWQAAQLREEAAARHSSGRSKMAPALESEKGMRSA
jgi:hypothetical protein